MAKKKSVPSQRSTRRREAHAEDHQRSLWRGAISFGLVNVPVQIVSAREQPALHFTMLDPSNLSPVGYKFYNKATGEEINRNRAVKAYQYKPKNYVILSDADFKKANPKATQTIDIENFVALNEIDPVFFDRAYYLLPGQGGERGYRLLCDALAKSGKVAIAKVVLHTKQHLVAVIARGQYLLLELLHFAEDVKELRELEDRPSEAKASRNLGKEIEMAERLIADMTTRWNPDEYRDTYREDILKHVKAKVKAGKAMEITPESAVPETGSSAKVLDLMPLLRKSLTSKKTRKRA